MEKFTQLQELTASMADDAANFFGKGNKAAGTRLRKKLQELKGLAQDIRVEVQSAKNEG
ncbi:MAG: histone H1 [Chitinophagales bacterium]|nr:histone H1 [Chitinophagales bacterium]